MAKKEEYSKDEVKDLFCRYILGEKIKGLLDTEMDAYFSSTDRKMLIEETCKKLMYDQEEETWKKLKPLVKKTLREQVIETTGIIHDYKEYRQYLNKTNNYGGIRLYDDDGTYIGGYFALYVKKGIVINGLFDHALKDVEISEKTFQFPFSRKEYEKYIGELRKTLIGQK